MFQYQTMMYRFNVLLSGVATCLEKEETCVTVIHAVSPLAPGGDEIARVDDFDMPEHHSHGP